MKNLNENVPTAEQLINDFKRMFDDVQEIRNTLVDVFLVYHGSDVHDVADQQDRAEKSYHMRVLVDFLKKIEKYPEQESN